MPHNRASYKLVLAILLLLQIYIPGTAFCLEENGNAAIENYSNGLCSDVVSDGVPGKEYAGTVISEYNSGDGHCGSCIDIPVSERASDKKVQSENEMESDMGIHSLALFTLPLITVEANLYQPALKTVSLAAISSIVSLQTTVIIC
ncbi:MAG: hypothetical protein RIG61_06965 [Deltaproteobacteria bacterium]